jgi:hypothetical protein
MFAFLLREIAWIGVYMNDPVKDSIKMLKDIIPDLTAWWAIKANEVCFFIEK